MAVVSVELAGALARVVGQKRVTIPPGTLINVLDSLVILHGDEFKDRLFDERGKPRRFINIYINGRDYRFLEKLDTLLQDGDVVSLLPAISGG